MPELKNEKPSPDELRAYVNERLEMSCISVYLLPPARLFAMLWFHSAAAIVALQRLDGLAFAQLSAGSIYAALSALNELPRSHSIWKNTKCRPTLFKLGDFCRMRLAEDPNDLTALWAMAVHPAWSGSNDFGQDAWLKLARLPGFDVRWPIYAALTVNLTANFNQEQMVDFLLEANLEAESKPVLLQLARLDSSLVAIWAALVLQGMTCSRVSQTV